MKDIIVLPEKHRVECKTDLPMASGSLSEVMGLMMACGGKGLCATCHVIIEGGEENLSPLTQNEDRSLNRITERKAKSRLACQACVKGPVTVRKPEGTYVETEQELQLMAGKRAASNILHPADGRILVQQGQVITKFVIKQILAQGLRSWEK